MNAAAGKKSSPLRPTGPALAPPRLLRPHSHRHAPLPPAEPSPFGGADPWLCIKRTFNPSLIIRKRRHGFRSRMSNRGGRKVIARRQAKGRWRITA